MADTAAATLYQRLGGYDAVAAATDELLRRLHGAAQLGGYWKGASDDNQRRARQLIVDFLTEAAGGPAFYTGRDMRKSHAGMHIGAADWAVFMRHAADTLAHLGVAAREQGEVLAFLATFEAEIVEG